MYNILVIIPHKKPMSSHSMNAGKNIEDLSKYSPDFKEFMAKIGGNIGHVQKGTQSQMRQTLNSEK
jgi:hypothetical protein